MKYFNTLPLTVTTDNKNNYVLLTNLIKRATLLPKLANNINLFYEYDIQEGDTPESIAYKYYGDQYNYWMILHANQIFDAQWEWPLTSSQFDDYLNDKYLAAAQEASMDLVQYLNYTIHHYEKLVITLDGESKYQATKNVIIDKETYDNLEERSYTNTLLDGTTVSFAIKKQAVSLFDYEIGVNESKRKIKIIRMEYVRDMEQQLSLVMS